jgi:tagaturonate reductase
MLLMKLSRKLLQDQGFKLNEAVKYLPVPENLPERVIQFGEGNFLRGFVDWMFTKLLQRGLFDGKIVVVQPLPSGRVAALNAQDGLSTVILRGIKDGKPTEEKEVITSISRGIDPYRQWDEYLRCAENPNFITVSNTLTERLTRGC